VLSTRERAEVPLPDEVMTYTPRSPTATMPTWLLQPAPAPAPAVTAVKLPREAKVAVKGASIVKPPVPEALGRPPPPPQPHRQKRSMSASSMGPIGTCCPQVRPWTPNPGGALHTTPPVPVRCTHLYTVENPGAPAATMSTSPGARPMNAAVAPPRDGSLLVGI
jgi:hypothetical protein